MFSVVGGGYSILKGEVLFYSAKTVRWLKSVHTWVEYKRTR